ncbi:hypothetical protein D3C78_1043500 [compost metagenome]
MADEVPPQLYVLGKGFASQQQGTRARGTGQLDLIEAAPQVGQFVTGKGLPVDREGAFQRQDAVLEARLHGQSNRGRALARQVQPHQRCINAARGGAAGEGARQQDDLYPAVDPARQVRIVIERGRAILVGRGQGNP